MPVPSPAIADIETPKPDERVEAAKPCEVASTIPPSDQPLPESRGMDAGFVKYLAVPGDNDTLSITLAIRPESLALWNREMKRVVEPGTFTIMAGGNSQDVKSTTLTVTP